MKSFRITPLGGIGKIGGNSLLVEGHDSSVLIDAGIEFPFERCFGIDYLIPPFVNHAIPNSLIITHGHEDHIGAIPQLLSLNPDLKIYAPNFAATLIRKKLAYQKLNAHITAYEPNITFVINSITITPIPLPHSIPDNYGLFITQDDNEVIFFASDFTLDDSEKTISSINKIAQYSKKFTNRLLFADSTNISSDKNPSEQDLIRDLTSIISNANDRVLITCFASNVDRIRIIATIAKKLNRKLTVYGRSMNNYIATAVECGILDPELIYETENFDRPDLVVLISGCQGDFRSTLRRIASGDDPKVQPNEKDTFFFSSKVIPGNETQVNHIIDLLSSLGTKIVDSRSLITHISGHASKNQLKALYRAFIPTILFPVHGNYHHLIQHKNFLSESAPEAKAELLLNGSTLRTGSSPAITMPDDEHKMILIQNGTVLPRSATKDRRKMANQGILVLSVNRDSIGSRKIKYHYQSKGLPDLNDDQINSLKQILGLSLSKKKGKALEKLEKDLNLTLRTFFKSAISAKPIIIIHFV